MALSNLAKQVGDSDQKHTAFFLTVMNKIGMVIPLLSLWPIWTNTRLSTDILQQTFLNNTTVPTQAPPATVAPPSELVKIITWMITTRMVENMKRNPKAGVLDSSTKNLLYKGFCKEWFHQLHSDRFAAFPLVTKGKSQSFQVDNLEGVETGLGNIVREFQCGTYAKLKPPLTIRFKDGPSSCLSVHMCYGVYNRHGVEQWTQARVKWWMFLINLLLP
jgi:hypothetical protein